MARWRLSKTRSFDPHGTSRTAKQAWAIDAVDQETGAEQTVKIFQPDGIPDSAFTRGDVRRALRDPRRTLDQYLDDDELPPGFLIVPSGIRRLDEDEYVERARQEIHEAGFTLLLWEPDDDGGSWLAEIHRSTQGGVVTEIGRFPTRGDAARAALLHVRSFDL